MNSLKRKCNDSLTVCSSQSYINYKHEKSNGILLYDSLHLCVIKFFSLNSTPSAAFIINTKRSNTFLNISSLFLHRGVSHAFSNLQTYKV